MIKFEEHDGKLFKMLDKPVPLKEKNTDVLVQFITHGVIGEYVMEHWLDCNQKNVPIYVENVDSDGDVTVCIENGNEHHCCPFPMFEIIGYPVADGSKEWALYQMMQGKMVCHETSPWDWYRMYSDHAIQNRTVGYMDRVSAWLESTVQSGWQIYTEPKPESQYKGYGIKDLKPDNLYLNIKPLNPADWCFDKKNLLVLVDDNFKGIVGENVTREQVVEIVKLLTEPAPKLKVVPITISGTVRQAYNEDGTIDDEQFQLLPNGSWDGTEMFISFDALDSHTRKLVKSLLKAQEEEK